MKKPPQQLESSNEQPSTESHFGDLSPLHIPVLLDSVVELLSPKTGESYLDLTAGYGGHARAIIEHTAAPEQATLVDRDANAIAELQSFAEAGAHILQKDFAASARELVEQGKQFDMVLVDLGVSSPQLDRATRGFSFKPGPLDMRMDQTMMRTAEEIINRSSERELIDILVTYGEERLSVARTIARAIVMNRPLHSTNELADIVLATHRGKWQKTHPATRTFQAFRIVVNDELGQIEQLLPLIPKLLTDNGRIAIISFHSLEDRLVKRYFSEQASAGYEAELRLLTKKAIRGATADVHNPRARSASLRAAAKIKRK